MGHFSESLAQRLAASLIEVVIHVEGWAAHNYYGRVITLRPSQIGRFLSEPENV